MDKKILSRPIYNLNNEALEKAVRDFLESNRDFEKLKEVVRLFKTSHVIIPVAFPPNADKRIVLKLLRGEPLKKGEDIPLFPVMVSDKNGNKFAPAFTSRNAILKAADFPYMIRVPAAKVIENVLQEKAGLFGMILNPQTQSFVLKKQAFETDFSNMQPQKQVKKVTKDQFEVLARNSVEKVQIPKLLFEQKEAFVQELEEKGEAFLLEMYAKPYGDKVPSPYKLEDFSVMALNIDEETLAICLELPKKGIHVGMARSAYIVWNPKTEEGHYYMIEKGAKGESDVLCNITTQGEHQELMTAPPVGSELTAVLELIREDEEDA